MKKINTTIEIDCEPFAPRPNVYFQHIWNEILHRKGPAPNTISRLFGNWTWEIPITAEEEEKVGEYIKSLYHSGKIRYGSW